MVGADASKDGVQPHKSGVQFEARRRQEASAAPLAGPSRPTRTIVPEEESEEEPLVEWTDKVEEDVKAGSVARKVGLWREDKGSEANLEASGVALADKELSAFDLNVPPRRQTPPFLVKDEVWAEPWAKLGKLSMSGIESDLLPTEEAERVNIGCQSFKQPRVQRFRGNDGNVYKWKRGLHVYYDKVSAVCSWLVRLGLRLG